MHDAPICTLASRIRLDGARGIVEGVLADMYARPARAEPIAQKLRSILHAAITRLAPGATYDAASATCSDLYGVADKLGRAGYDTFDDELRLAARILRDILNDLED